MGTVVTALAAVALLVRRVQVRGDSMAPTLLPGDRLLVVRAGRARPGQLVVVDDPRPVADGARHRLVKRVAAVEEDGRAMVVGDNAAASTDSAVFGAVEISGRVLYRYHPPERAGRLR